MKRIILFTFALQAAPAQIVAPIPLSTGRVIGKPYTATQVNRFIQTLTNGAHSDRSVTTLISQDDQGRFRRETLGQRPHVIIEDFVAQSTYILDLEQKTVRKIDMKVSGLATQTESDDISPAEEARSMTRRSPGTLVEDLGPQFVNGVSVRGVRITTTIPVGAIGNDQPLKSVTERWYSNDIHALVKSITTDPRSGLSTYELKDIVRAAPDPALFQVPQGFTLTTRQPSPQPEQQ